MQIPLAVKRNGLLIITGLVVAYVRRVIQYGNYSWDSVVQLLGWWLLHYLAVGLVAAVAYGCIKGTEKFFFGYESGEKGLGVDEALVYISVVILVAAVAVFFIAHWPASDVYE